MRVHAAFTFLIPRWVAWAEDLLMHRLESSDGTCWLEFKHEDLAFRTRPEAFFALFSQAPQQEVPLPPLRLKTELAQDGPPPHGAYAPADFYRSANVVIVGLPMVLDLGCAPQPREDQAAELTPERAEELLVGQMQRAQSIYKLFLDWVRSVAGPGWGDDAYLLADEPVRARLLDDEGWPLSRGSAATERFRSRPARLTAASALGLMDSAVSGAAPPLASLLLAEALDNGFGRQAPDFRVAVLLGAIACEVGIKQALQQAATPEQQDLLQLVIDKPRDVSLSAVSLYDSPSRILLRRSPPRLRTEAGSLIEASQACVIRPPWRTNCVPRRRCCTGLTPSCTTWAPSGSRSILLPSVHSPLTAGAVSLTGLRHQRSKKPAQTSKAGSFS